MTKTGQHIIQRQILDISTGDLKTASALDQQVTAVMQQVILPTLERCFDNLLPPDQYLLLNRLEIDLGLFSEKDFQHGLATRLEKNVLEVLRQHLNQAKQNPVEEPTIISKTAQSTNTRNDKDVDGLFEILEAQLDNAALRATPERNFDAFLYFLKNGRLPWWKSSNTGTLENDLPKDLTQAQRAALKNLLVASLTARVRLASQVSEECISGILVQLGGTSAWSENWQFLEQYSTFPPANLHAIRQYYWESCLSAVLENGRSAELAYVIQRVMEKTPTSLMPVWEAFFQRLNVGEPELKDKLPAPLKKALSQFKGVQISSKKNKRTRKTEENYLLHGSTDYRLVSTKKATESSKKATESNKNDQEPVADGAVAKAGEVFVEDAGLVLLHSFLPAFFEACSLVKNNQFVTKEAAMRGVQLLGWLATASDNVPEYQLLLPKVLCGIEWETPLMTSAPLTDHERQEANQLLLAIVAHWKALGNTSADGLREGFIRRMGKLEKRENAWRMDVESKGVDVLLARLPWGISTIKLPWMKTILHVSWG